MTLIDFLESVRQRIPPDAIDGPLLGLWYDASGEWEKAHDVVQSEESSEAAWVHAYLHRREGDNANASYWYRRAGRPLPAQQLEQEWNIIVEELLNRQT